MRRGACCVLAVLGVLAVPGPATAADQAALAKRLAAGVAAADTLGEREHEVRDVFRALRVGVLTPRGRVVVRGARATAGVPLYSFETKAIARGLESKGRLPLDKLAAVLERAGLHPRGKPLDPGLLASAMAQASNGLSRSKNAALAGHLVRELGSGGGDLDALQMTILLLDAQAWARRGSRARGRTRPHARSASIGDACQSYEEAQDEFEELDKKTDGKLGEYTDKYVDKLKEKLSGFFPRTTKAFKKLQGTIAQELAEAVHGSALAYTVAVTPSPPVAPEIHRPHDDQTERVLELRIKVEVLDDFGDDAIRCGKLAGVEVPKQGGLADVPVIWAAGESLGLGALEKHGTIDCPDKGCAKTDDEGFSTLRVKLRRERIAGVGLDKHDRSHAAGLAEYQTRFGAEANLSPQLIRYVAQFLFAKYEDVVYDIGYHDEPALSLRFSVSGRGDANGPYHAALGGTIPLTTTDETAGTADGSGPIAYSDFFLDRQQVVCDDGTNSSTEYAKSDGTDPGALAANLVASVTDEAADIKLRLEEPAIALEYVKIRRDGDGCPSDEERVGLPILSASVDEMMNMAGHKLADFAWQIDTGWERTPGSIAGGGPIARRVLRLDEGGDTADLVLEIVATPR